MQAILECDNLGDSAKNIPISVTKYSGKPYKSRAVISGVPIDVSEYDIVESLSDTGVIFAKRLKRRTDKGLEYSLSMLLGFKSNQAPESVKLGYLIFRTKPYNPPPLRCFNCNIAYTVTLGSIAEGRSVAPNVAAQTTNGKTVIRRKNA